MARFPKLKVVVRMGVGYDRIDRAEAARRRITVCNCPDYGTTEVADHALALAMTLRRGVLLHHEAQRCAAAWKPIDDPLVLVRRLSSLTVGIVGLGRIGTAAALPEAYEDIKRKSAETMRAVLIDNQPQNVIPPEAD